MSYNIHTQLEVETGKGLCATEQRTARRVVRQIVIRDDITMKGVSELLLGFRQLYLKAAHDPQTLLGISYGALVKKMCGANVGCHSAFARFLGR